MKDLNSGYRSLLKKLAIVSGSVMVALVAVAPAETASTTALPQAVSINAAPPTPTPTPSPKKEKNHTVTNPAPPGPLAPRAGLAPLQGGSRLQRSLLAAGVSAPASALPAAPCAATGTALTCTLWAKPGTLTLPAQAQPLAGTPATIVAPLTISVWGFATSASGPALVPGPVLIANADQSISIHVYNQLPAAPDGENALSIEVPASSARPDLSGIERNNDKTWNFGTLSPGTYLYEAGAAPFGPRQVRMGLAGILVVRPAAATFQACSCAYGNAANDSFVDESTMVLNEFDPAFNADPFGFDPIDFNPSEFTMNGQAYDPANPSAGAIGVLGGTFDILLLHYANLTDHERGVTIGSERQRILADDSHVLTNPLDVATKWLNPGQVSDSFVTIDPSFAPGTHLPIYEAGFHFNNGTDSGLGGMFTYLNVTQGTIGSPSGPVTSVSVSPSTNSGTEPLIVSGTITPGAGATLTDAEWFLDYPGAPGTAPTCPTGGLSLTGFGSGYTNPIVTISAPGGSGTTATATVSGKMDVIKVPTGGGGSGYTSPSVTVAGGSATASGSVDAVSVLPAGSHYTTPKVTFSGGGGAIANTTGPVDGLTFGTAGAGYTSPSVVLGGGGGSGASATVTGSVDSLTGSGGSGYTAPTVQITSVDSNGSGATATAQFIPGGAITGLTIDTGGAGSGYTQAPTVTISDPTGTGATTKATISVTSITLGFGGSLYSSAPTVSINDSGGGTGTGATATATVGVTGVAVTNGGSGYTAAPGVTIGDSGLPAGSGALATATLTITAITINPGGAGDGYTTAPAVTIGDSGLPMGSGATAAATLTLDAITLTNAGAGYATPPSVTISDPGHLGTGATAIATLPATTCLYMHIAVSGTTPFIFKFTIASADLSNLLLTALNVDGDHIIWVRGQDTTGGTATWGAVSGDVFTYNKTGPVVGALTLHVTPTNGKRPTDVANGAGAPDPITGMNADLPNNDLVILGGAASSLSNFVVTGAEYCIDTKPCPPNPAIPNNPNPTGPTAIVLTPGGFDGSRSVDAYGLPLPTPAACTPLSSPPGLSGPPVSSAAPGGGNIVSFCGTVPSSVLLSLPEGPHTLFIHACEQVATSPTACDSQPVKRWAAFNDDASIQFVVDKTGPVVPTGEISVTPNPNNGFQPGGGNTNFVDVAVLAATFADPAVPHMSTGSNVAYAEAFVTCSPRTLPCQSTDTNPVDPTTGLVPPDGSGAEMSPSGGAWDSPTKLAYAYVPLAELTKYHEGYVRFWVHGQDQAGNFGGWFYTDLTFDKTAPVFTAPNPATAPNAVHCSTGAGCTIHFAASDPLSSGVNSNIVEAEWFIGTADPGFGNGTQITIAVNPSVAGNVHFLKQPVGTLITFRVRDAAGNWSLNNVVRTT
jgi:hypothetical protein